MVAEPGCKRVAGSGCSDECWLGLLARQPSVCSSTIFVWFPICWSSNVSHGCNATPKIQWRLQTETNGVSERATRLDAEQHVTVQRQRLTRNPSTQGQTQSSVLIDTQVWRKPGKLDVPSCGTWNDRERVMLPHIDQLHKKLTNASGVGNSCHERGLEQWPREGQQLYAALLAHAEPYRKVAGECLEGR